MWQSQLYAQPNENKNAGRQQFCSLGDFTLENGEVIYDCKVGYRVYGKPYAAMSNIIFGPAWITGTSENHEAIVPGKFIDTSIYHLIIVDPLGNGVSSSPSNSNKQPRLQFPKFSIRDMVKSQYQMLTEF